MKTDSNCIYQRQKLTKTQSWYLLIIGVQMTNIKLKPISINSIYSHICFFYHNSISCIAWATLPDEFDQTYFSHEKLLCEIDVSQYL